MNLALATRQPLSEILAAEPEDLATMNEWLDDRNDAIKDAQRSG